LENGNKYLKQERDQNKERRNGKRKKQNADRVYIIVKFLQYSLRERHEGQETSLWSGWLEFQMLL
jgi:hypothetical protein